MKRQRCASGRSPGGVRRRRSAGGLARSTSTTSATASARKQRARACRAGGRVAPRRARPTVAPRCERPRRRRSCRPRATPWRETAVGFFVGVGSGGRRSDATRRFSSSSAVASSPRERPSSRSCRSRRAPGARRRGWRSGNRRLPETRARLDVAERVPRRSPPRTDRIRPPERRGRPTRPRPPCVFSVSRQRERRTRLGRRGDGSRRTARVAARARGRLRRDLLGAHERRRSSAFSREWAPFLGDQFLHTRTPLGGARRADSSRGDGDARPRARPRRAHVVLPHRAARGGPDRAPPRAVALPSWTRGRSRSRHGGSAEICTSPRTTSPTTWTHRTRTWTAWRLPWPRSRRGARAREMAAARARSSDADEPPGARKGGDGNVASFF